MISFFRGISFFIAFFSCISNSHAICTDIEPKELYPGDAFVVRLTDKNPSDEASVRYGDVEIPLSGCGKDCLFGIGAVDMDTKPGEHRVVVVSGNYRHDMHFSVMPANFPEMKLKLPKSKVALSSQDLARVKREEAMLKVICKQMGPQLYRGDFILPLANPVSAVFGARRIMNNEIVSIHRGIDFRARRGEEIRSANNGRIVLAEELFFGGNTIVIDHGAGIFTIYMHLDGFAAKVGDPVKRGDVIGLAGSTGRATGPHLHFGVKILDISTNPLSLTRLKLN